MKNNTKSSAVAGILGVFLGAVGGHDWYLNNTKKAIIHVSLCVGGLLLLMVAIILTSLSKSIPAINVLFICLMIMSYVIIVGNAVWGIIEGIVIIAQGDAGLKAKGYQVADLATTTMAPVAPVVATGDAKAPVAENAQAEVANATGNFAVADNSKIEPAHLDNIITAAPANGSVMSSAPVAQATPGVATPANPTMVTPAAAPASTTEAQPAVKEGATPAPATTAPTTEEKSATTTSVAAPVTPVVEEKPATVAPANASVAAEAKPITPVNTEAAKPEGTTAPAAMPAVNKPAESNTDGTNNAVGTGTAAAQNNPTDSVTPPVSPVA